MDWDGVDVHKQTTKKNEDNIQPFWLSKDGQ